MVSLHKLPVITSMKNFTHKGLIILSVALMMSVHASALTCTDLTKNLSKGSENTSVKLLQGFLFEKGFLKANPNGYYGVGTVAAVKAYQKSVGVSPVGYAGPGTREFIKKDSCTKSASATTVSGVTNTQVALPIAPVVKNEVVVVPPKPKTPVDDRNSRRTLDVETILHGIYNEFVYTGGIVPVPIVDAPIELCVTPQSVLDANATATVPTLPCSKYIDITKISPYRLKNIPRDPAIATSSTLIGYAAMRNSHNDVSVVANYAEGNITIKATCNFNSMCSNVERISGAFYDTPNVASTSRSVLIKGASLVSPFIIYGKNFTASNTVVLSSNFPNKKYVLGSFPSTDKVTIPLQPKDLNRAVSCGPSCIEEIQPGEYDLMIRNEGGESSVTHISIKGYSSSITFVGTESIKPNTKNTKIASIMLNVGIPVTLKSITLTATNTPTTLLSKISHVTLKDADTGTSYGGGSGGTSLSNQTLSTGQSKVYDFYADVDTMAFTDVGNVTYAGYFTVADIPEGSTAPVDFTLPIKDLMFMVSY